jgi:dTDP-4-amino-4,6-dideoxygalactose transaminase
MKKVGKFLKARRAIAEYYTKKLSNDARFGLPFELKGSKSAWHLYPLRLLDSRINKEKLFRKFRGRNIFPQVHFIPIHTHPYYQNRFDYKQGDFPKAERFYEEEISLPLYPSLTKKEADEVIGILKNI